MTDKKLSYESGDSDEENEDIDEACPVCGHNPCIATQGGCCGEPRYNKNGKVDW